MAVEGEAYAQRAVARAGSSPVKATAEGAATGTRVMPRDEAVRVLYQSHYAELVRIAALLVGDVRAAEDLVQDSFIAMHRAWWRLHDSRRAVPYLRRSVMNRARSVLRHRMAVDRHHLGPAPNLPSAREGTLAMLERSSVLGALDAMPVLQRQVIVLRYYADLSETQTANALGIATGSVKSYATRALDSLRRAAP